MEMSYDGALVLPQNYASMDEDEMMYIDGGWSYRQVIKNAVGLAAIAGLSYVGNAIANFVRANPGLGLWKTVAKISVTAAKALWALPWWAKVAGLAAGACVVYALGTWDIF